MKQTTVAVVLDWNSVLIRMWAVAGLGFALTLGSVAQGSQVTPERPIFRPSMEGGETGAVSDKQEVKPKKDKEEAKAPRQVEFAAKFEWNQTDYRAEIQKGVLTLAREDTGEVTARCSRIGDEALSTGEIKASDYLCTGFPLSGLKTRASIEYGEKPLLKLGSWVDGYETAVLKVLIHRGGSLITRI